MTFPRASGILLHPTSLPGSHGIGDLGEGAYRFADFLVAAGQSLWQVLPLGPTGYGDSPYACYSAFAGNTLLISPEQLIADDLLSQTDLQSIPSFPQERVDFDAVHKFKDSILNKAFEHFKRSSDQKLRNEFAEFSRNSARWLDDYALFRALKDAYKRTSWNQWEPPLVLREPAALS